MTAVALRDDYQPATSSGLVQWAEEAKQAAGVAVSLAKTPFVPASLRDRDPGVTAANITACILTGRELGLEPMAALRSIDVIQGTPALRAIALRAVVLAAGHEMWVAESTQTRAIVRGRRKGSDQVQESKWDLDRAQKLGLAGKENWRKQPGAMLVARATAECSRLIAADAILGVPYIAEELADESEAQIVPVDVGPRRTAQRRNRQQPAAVHRPPIERQETPPYLEPDFDEPTPTDEPAAEVTDAQRRKLQALYHDLGIVDRAERLADIGAVVGRDVTSSNDLTKGEASTLIDRLEQRAQSALFADGAS